MNYFLKLNPARISTWLIIVVVVYVNLNLGLWKDPHRIFRFDILSYYAYLPATFIYDDISLDFTKTNFDKFSNYFWPKTAPNGNYVITASMGMSFMYFPFFLAAHPLAQFQGYDANGFSPPYALALVIASIFYLSVGLFFLRRLLEKYFSSWVTAITLFSIVITTNMLWYAVAEPAMTHVFSFSLIAVLLFHIDKFHACPGLKTSVYIGLLAGLISLIRPTNILILIVFFLWKVYSWDQLKKRILFFYDKYSQVIVMILMFFLVWFPQFLYWNLQTGNYLYYSYPDDEGFFWSNPHILKGLFSYRKGWFLYTPLMILIIPGIVILYRKFREFFWPFIIFILINLYIMFSWWAWWYGGGLGQRALIDFYALMAFPLAAFLTWAWKQKTYLKVSLTVLWFLFSLQGLMHHFQYHYGAIHWDSMSKAAYWNSYGRVRPSAEFINLLEPVDYDMAKKGVYQIVKPEAK